MRARQQHNVRRLKAMLQAAGMPLLDTPSHILPLIIGEAHQCRRTSELLLAEHRIYLQPINYPTVARGQERLRITPTPFTVITTCSISSMLWWQSARNWAGHSRRRSISKPRPSSEPRRSS
jgi:7-keto-8-aminopelargonate synthetase-like enzyme